MIEILEILLAPFRPKDARSFVSVEGLKPVCCENCSTQYFYEHSVIGSSPASSWYFNPPTPTQVQERDKLALKNGNETFHRNTVPVVCPECDRLQQCMLLDLQQLTARKWNNPLYICLGLAILVGLFGSIGMINAKLNPQNVRHSEALEFCLAVMCIASILLLVAVGLYCVRSYISNADSSSIFFRKAIRMHRYKALSVRQAIIHYLTLHVSSSRSLNLNSDIAWWRKGNPEDLFEKNLSEQALHLISDIVPVKVWKKFIADAKPHIKSYYESVLTSIDTHSNCKT